MTGDGETAATPSRGDVVDALSRVLDSPAFERSERARAFLAHVVSESLAGRDERISERTVGRAVLGRGPAFDGGSDSSVRVTATRVRRALQRYYETDGDDDPVRIVLPQGSYAPVFEPGGRGAEVPDVVPGVLVLVPDPVGGDEAAVLAAATADSLVQALIGFDALRVVGPTSADGDLAAAGRAAGVSHVLDGRVALRGTGARLVVRLVSSLDGGVLWSRSVDEPDDEAGRLLALEDGWAREVAAQVADLGGVLASDVIARFPGDPRPLMRARLAYFAYIERATKEATQEAIEALDAALDVGPRTAPLLTMRGAVENAAVLFGMRDRTTGTDLAESLAREALVLDGTSAHAYLVLGGCARNRGRWAQSRQHAEAAVALTPWNPTNLITGGLLVSASGDWDRGSQLIRRALELNPRFPINIRLWFALDHALHGRYELALAEATLFDVDGQVFGPLYRCLALSGLGDVEAAREEMARVLAIDPTLLETAADQFQASMNLTDEQLARVVDLLERARPTA